MPSEKLHFSTIEQVLEHKFVGNHFDDQAAFEAIERYARRKDVTRKDKNLALRHIRVNGMGFDK